MSVKKYTFKGGIHPDDSKGLTKDIPIKQLPVPEVVYIPLRQHIGALLEPCVKVGDYVKKGQIIGNSEAFVSVPVHATVSGTVKAIEPYFHPSGVKVPAIVIENDGQETLSEDIKPVGEYYNLTPAEIISAIRNAGIVGMGGATFPTHVKLSPPKDKKIEYVIINGAECEPYLTSDHRVMLENTEEVIYGLKAIMHIFSLDKGYIAVENNKPDAIKALREAIKDDPSVEICEMITKYPQGSEKQLINAITGREVPSGGLPADVGVVVNNIDTCVTIARALRTGMPLLRRIVTVSGKGINNPANYEVRIGTPFKYVAEAAGGIKENVRKVIMGGPMMGMAQYNLDTPVTKGTSGLLFLLDNEIYDEKEMPCTKCGKCVDSCPMGLMPLYLMAYSKNENYEGLKKYHLLDCMECGSCCYVCPSKKKLIQHIRVGKAKLQIKMRKEN